MRRKVCFLTMAETTLILESLYHHSKAHTQLAGRLREKIVRGPMVSQEVLEALDRALGETLDHPGVALSVLQYPASVKAARSGWKSLYGAFFACTSSCSIVGKL